MSVVVSPSQSLLFFFFSLRVNICLAFSFCTSCYREFWFNMLEFWFSNIAIHSHLFPVSFRSCSLWTGTIILWLYWPSFNGSPASGDQRHRVVINTYYSLSACVVVTFAFSTLLSKEGKIDMVSCGLFCSWILTCKDRQHRQ